MLWSERYLSRIQWEQNNFQEEILTHIFMGEQKKVQIRCSTIIIAKK